MQENLLEMTDRIISETLWVIRQLQCSKTNFFKQFAGELVHLSTI